LNDPKGEDVRDDEEYEMKDKELKAEITLNNPNKDHYKKREFHFVTEKEKQERTGIEKFLKRRILRAFRRA
jgi:hypothetical protein